MKVLNMKLQNKIQQKTDTIMLFRCTTQEYAERFLATGNIRFGTPQEWIDYYKEHGDGRGDLLEGAFASICDLDERPINFYKLYRPNVLMTHDERSGNYYFQSSDVLKFRTFCLFGLNKSHFTRDAEGEDRNIYPTGSITQKYFEDFSSISRENYDNLPKEEKPVLLMISNPHEFFERLKQALFKMGFKENEFIIHPVRYVDKQKPFLIGDSVPGELFAKDMYFEYQSEIRVVLMPNNPLAVEQLEQKNGILDLGSMEDIAEIHEYYFSDFFMQLRGNSILFVLSKPIETPITDPLSVIGYIHQVYRDEIPGGLLSIEKRDILVAEAADFLDKQFNIMFDETSLTFFSKDGTQTWKLNGIWEALYNHGCSYHSRGDYWKAVDQYTKAIAIAPERPEAWYNRAVSYFKLGDFGAMFDNMDKAIELDPDNEKYINERREQLKRLRKI